MGSCQMSSCGYFIYLKERLKKDFSCYCALYMLLVIKLVIDGLNEMYVL